jgi:dihydroxy-acid dehydratase
LVQVDDRISFDLLEGTVTLHVDDAELGRRRTAWVASDLPSQRGYLADFSATVSQAGHGCVSRALYPHCAPSTGN